MENYILENDIILLCETAASFPDGILAAHQKLHALFPRTIERKYYGISRPGEDGIIIYKAAVEALSENEADTMPLEKYILKKGTYITIDITNYMNDTPAIGNAFRLLLADPAIDLNGECAEWYLNDKVVKCMVRLSAS